MAEAAEPLQIAEIQRPLLTAPPLSGGPKMSLVLLLEVGQAPAQATDEQASARGGRA